MGWALVGEGIAERVREVLLRRVVCDLIWARELAEERGGVEVSWKQGTRTV